MTPNYIFRYLYLSIILKQLVTKETRIKHARNNTAIRLIDVKSTKYEDKRKNLQQNITNTNSTHSHLKYFVNFNV